MDTGVPGIGVVGARRALVDHPSEGLEVTDESTIPEQPDRSAMTLMTSGVALVNQRFGTL
jgi:hypothetical protein